LKEIDERTHCYALMPVEYSQHQGNFRQVRQAAQDRKERTAAGGDNERGLDYIPKGFNRRVPKPTRQQFEQWRHEEPDLLRSLQGGDYGAAAILAERYRWWLQVGVVEVIKKVRGGLRFDDLFDCALIQFCESLKEFRPGSNNGLMAYLTKAIDGAISDAHQKWQSKGFTEFDTRLRRFLRNEANRNASLEQIQKLFPKYTLEEITQALTRSCRAGSFLDEDAADGVGAFHPSQDNLLGAFNPFFEACGRQADEDGGPIAQPYLDLGCPFLFGSADHAGNFGLGYAGRLVGHQISPRRPRCFDRAAQSASPCAVSCDGFTRRLEVASPRSPTPAIDSSTVFPPDPVVRVFGTGSPIRSVRFFRTEACRFSVPAFCFCCRLRQLLFPCSTA
jgi:hypothetical protein